MNPTLLALTNTAKLANTPLCDMTQPLSREPFTCKTIISRLRCIETLMVAEPALLSNLSNDWAKAFNELDEAKEFVLLETKVSNLHSAALEAAILSKFNPSAIKGWDTKSPKEMELMYPTTTKQ